MKVTIRQVIKDAREGLVQEREITMVEAVVAIADANRDLYRKLKEKCTPEEMVAIDKMCSDAMEKMVGPATKPKTPEPEDDEVTIACREIDEMQEMRHKPSLLAGIRATIVSTNRVTPRQRAVIDEVANES